MSAKLSLVVVLALLSIVSARVIREAPKEENVASDIFQSVDENIQKLKDAVFKVFEVKNEEELNNKIKEQGKDIAKTFDQKIGEARQQFSEFQDSENFKKFKAEADRLFGEITKNFKN
ncbi:uncharacterized protein LOC119665922 [Teleopsis dalmanni]|uniref:uncharacterized protein LOC119665922 n=1 Tax=Teleopsis dalmanni TaxID=139649 RepID=UPI0018CD4C0D|nr:uncharacterized protein LOC119665922 [Teleopsis dalmanni]